MPWEDCYFAHTDDNRFTNTVHNAWFGIHDESESEHRNKTVGRVTIKREIGGAGMGFGKRPYLHSDYNEMLKSTTDKEAFDRMAARGYFPGRATLERPYGSKHYQEMKYQKPVPPILAETPPELSLERPEFEIPDVAAPGLPTAIIGRLGIPHQASRVKFCTTDSYTADGIEIFDGNTVRVGTEGTIDFGKINISIYNIAQLRQTSPYIYMFIFDPTVGEIKWRKCTSAEAGDELSTAILIKPGRLVQYYTRWLSIFNDTAWTADWASGLGYWKGDTNRWYSELDPSWYSLWLKDIGSWVTSYRPTKMKLSGFPATLQQVYLYDSSGYAIVDQAAVAAGDELTITNTYNRDIDTLYTIWTAGSAYYLNNIQFYL